MVDEFFQKYSDSICFFDNGIIKDVVEMPTMVER